MGGSNTLKNHCELVRFSANWCELVRWADERRQEADTSVFGVLGNGLAIKVILGRAGVTIYSFEHGDTLPQEDGHGLLAEVGLY